MALKDKLMTLEDFKAVRDVDVASNQAQFTEIKADLDSLDESLQDIGDILGATSETIITMPDGLKSVNYSNASGKRVFKYVNNQLYIKLSSTDTGSISSTEVATSTAGLSNGDAIAFDVSTANNPKLKLSYNNTVAGTGTAELILRFYKPDYSTMKTYAYKIPSGEGSANIDIASIIEDQSIDVSIYPKLIIRALGWGAHTATAAESTELFIDGYYESIEANPINTRVETLEGDVSDMADDISDLSDDVSGLSDITDAITTATAQDVGKVLTAKTISNGKVTEWEFKNAESNMGASGTDLYQMRQSIPSYYLAYPANPASFDEQEYLEERIKAVPAGKSFIFVTDTHWESNNKHTFDLIRYVRERLGIKKVLFGGDAIDRQNNKYKGLNVIRDFMSRAVSAFGEDFIVTIGNHDNNMANVISSGLDTETYRIPYDLVYDAMLSHLADAAVCQDWSTEIDSIKQSDADGRELLAWSKFHYYIDDDDNHIRYVVLYSSCPDDVLIPAYTDFPNDTGGGPTTVMQLEWFASTLMSTPAGYDVVTLAHCGDSEAKNFPDQKELRAYFDYFVRIASAIHLKCTGFKLNVAYFAEDACPTNAFWTRETKQWDFSAAPNIGRICFIAGHIHQNMEYVTKISSASASNPTYAKGKARNNGNPALVGTVADVTVFDSATVDYVNGEIVTIIPQNDAYGQTPNTPSAEAMTVNTITDQAFDVITLTNSGIQCTRFGAGWDRFIPVTWVSSS